jgi:exodeoxyribonuclease V alpha subunit
MKRRTSPSLPPLSPLGTARQRLAPGAAYPPGLAEELRDADLGEEAAYLAWQVAAWAEELTPGERNAFLVLVARLLMATAQGSTRLPVGAAERAVLARAPALVGVAGERKPLLLEDGYLYPQKLYACEERVAMAIRARAGVSGVVSALEVARAMEAVVASTVPPLGQEQVAAVRAAVSGRLTVVSGGPGTGKTSIVLAIVRALARLGMSAADVALAAPTGKAANRLDEALAAGLGRLAASESEEIARIAAAPRAQTLHRLLGYSPGAGTFQHHQGNPLTHKMVIVDEGSMIDLLLIDRLLRALSDSTSLVLLGDADQLPSIEAGAVFRDLDAVAVRLGRSYRSDPEQGRGSRIWEVAARVRAGEAAALGSLLEERQGVDSVTFSGVELVPPSAREALLERWYTDRLSALDGFEALATQAYRLGPDGFALEDQARLDRLSYHLQRFRILCATRGRPTGVEVTNAWFHRRQGAPSGAMAPGEPVIMLRNDYDRGLFNGDQGLVVRVREEGRPPRLAVAFKRRKGWAAWDIDSLRDELALAYALTVHKAQGSEHDEVALLLPDQPIPLLSRELLYTALTRSRRAVIICGDPAVLVAAAARPLDRSTGIAEKLRPGG